MLYSQLYRSILCICREFTHHSRTTTYFAISLPLLVTMPSAYGVIVTPQSQAALPAYPAKAAETQTTVAVSNDTTSNKATSNATTDNSDEYINVNHTNNAELNAFNIEKNSSNPVADEAVINAAAITTTTQDSSSTSVSFKQRKKQASDLANRFKEDDVQQSLQRLSQFYQKQTEALNTETSTSTVIDAQAVAPAITSNLFGYQTDSAANYRCEGVWVTPVNAEANREYQQAIQRAQQQDGLSIANGLPLHAQANYAYYDNADYVELAGDVKVLQNGKLISAEQLTLDLNTGIADATGGILLTDSGASNAQNKPTNLESIASNKISNSNNSDLIAAADALAYNTNNNQATARDVAFASVSMQAHGYAKTLHKPDDTHYELEQVMFSTCPPTNRKWQIEAQKIDINTGNGRGEAYNATFRLGKVPVFYLPYFNFPVDDRRSSGLLTPSARIDSENGIKVSVPYYLNLAPNYDATVTSNFYSNRNPMLTSEIHYLTENYGQGSLTTSYMLKDKEYNDENRSSVFYEHQWASKSIPRLTADAFYSYVSDPFYLNDFDDYGLIDNRRNLPRRARLNYYDDYVNAQFKAESFQTLRTVDANGNIVLDKDKPYSRLPQLSINYRLPKFNNFFGNFLITGVHDTAYFKKSIKDNSDSEKSGLRIYNEIDASYPFEKSWGYITPKVSLHHIYAAFDEESRLDNNISKQDNSQSAFVPKFSLDSGLNFYQAGSPFGWFDQALGGYQLLTPRIKYSYSPYEDQRAIPNFDTRIASYDYDQLFADNWFLGYDRIADTNNLAVGLNYRYIDAMGVTRFDGSIGDQFFLDKPEITLDDSSESSFNSNSTGVAWRSSLQPYRNLWFDFNGALNSHNKLHYISSSIRYRPTENSLINFGVVERKEDDITNQSRLSALTTSAILPINQNWRFLGQGQYDSRNNKFIDSTLGIDYEDCCYGFSLYARSYFNDLNLEDKPTRAVMAEFRINGFGDRQSRLSKHLDKKILGFEPVDSVWKK